MSHSSTDLEEHTPDSNKWYKKLTDYPSNRENPFLEQVVAEMRFPLSVKLLDLKAVGVNLT